jgi:hypothetical protein
VSGIAPDVGEVAVGLLRGAISLHDHYGWERISRAEPRCRPTYDPVLIARSAAAIGMRAVVLKNLYFTSCGDAELVQRAVPEIEVYGGIMLNSEVGGINPTAVDTAMSYGGGAKFVGLANEASAHEARLAGVSETEIRRDPLRYVTPFEADGSVKTEMREILGIVGGHDVLLETGSLSPAEVLSIVEAAGAEGVQKVLVTHPQPWFCGMTIEQMQQAIDLGAVIEFSWNFYTHSASYLARRYGGNEMDPHVEEVGTAFDQITALGAENCVLSTDFGTLDLPLPVEGLREFIFCLLDLGLTEREISLMVRANPARLLGLPDLEPVALGDGSGRSLETTRGCRG